MHEVSSEGPCRRTLYRRGATPARAYTEVTLLEPHREVKPICRLAYIDNPGWPMARRGGAGKVALTESLNRSP
ncbi:Unknown protein sequence [Pseudomonas coronafaciens pv. oryzae]|nr:Unknown protein sequence [Pseudomonas coronafaciens pv. oryzae]